MPHQAGEPPLQGSQVISPGSDTRHDGSRIAALNRLFFGARQGNALQVDALDGIRGLAILMVLFSHLANEDILLVDGVKFAGDGSGKLGVYLFFTLSAFLLTRILIRTGDAHLKRPAVWADYLLRRLLRIFPLYLVVLLAVWAGSSQGLPYFFPDFDSGTVAAHLMLRESQHHFWSIPPEVQYYLVLPVFVLVFVFVVRRNPLAALILGVLAVVAVRRSEWLAFGHAPLPVVRYLPIFVAGSLCAVLHERVGSIRSAWLPRHVMTALGATCLVASILIMPNVQARLFADHATFFSRTNLPLCGLLYGVLIFAVLNERGVLTRLFSSKPLRLIGVVSFSIYLWHVFVLNAVALWFHDVPPAFTMAFFYAVMGLLGAVSYLAFERPLSRVRIVHLFDRKPPA